MHIAVTSPRVAVPDVRVKSTTFREVFLRLIAIISYPFFVFVIWTVALGESASILSPYLPSISGLFLRPSSPTLPLAFVTGSLLVTSGGILRWFCYRSLGRFFTINILVHKDHRLVTKGPYSFVRHPSYTGTFMLTIGVFLMQGHPDSWMRTSGILNFTPFKIVVIYCGCIMLAVAPSLSGRATHEDKMLKNHFGEEWDRWASVVRYRFLPGIY
jgi:protein-S-isoprenylcysteine O-methyltransferase Ste14